MKSVRATAKFDFTVRRKDPNGKQYSRQKSINFSPYWQQIEPIIDMIAYRQGELYFYDSTCKFSVFL
jgi:hypothetical protein